jgi:hypothetical protein
VVGYQGVLIGALVAFAFFAFAFFAFAFFAVFFAVSFNNVEHPAVVICSHFPFFLGSISFVEKF